MLSGLFTLIKAGLPVLLIEPVNVAPFGFILTSVLQRQVIRTVIALRQVFRMPIGLVVIAKLSILRFTRAACYRAHAFHARSLLLLFLLNHRKRKPYYYYYYKS